MIRTMLGALVVVSMVLPFAASAQQNEEPVYRPGNGVTLPKVIRDVKPQYTPDAMKDRIQGEVVLECVVTKSGVPTQIEVTRALDDRLDKQAISALEQWRFEPGKKDGEPVAVRVWVEMHFTLK